MYWPQLNDQYHSHPPSRVSGKQTVNDPHRAASKPGESPALMPKGQCVAGVDENMRSHGTAKAGTGRMSRVTGKRSG